MSAQETTVSEESPFVFLKRYYSRIDHSYYRTKAKELDVGYIDGFIGYIGYDMVQVFEPTLKEIHVCFGRSNTNS